MMVYTQIHINFLKKYIAFSMVLCKTKYNNLTSHKQNVRFTRVITTCQSSTNFHDLVFDTLFFFQTNIAFDTAIY